VTTATLPATLAAMRTGVVTRRRLMLLLLLATANAMLSRGDMTLQRPPLEHLYTHNVITIYSHKK